MRALCLSISMLMLTAAACGGAPAARPDTNGSTVTMAPPPQPTATSTPIPRSTPTPTPTPEPPPPPQPVHPRGTRTGITAIDGVIDAVERDDREALASLIGSVSFPCEVPRAQSPQPYVCREGMVPGDTLQGFLVTEVEGGRWMMPADRIAEALLTRLVALDAGLYSVYACRGTCEELGANPATEYLVTFAVWSSQSGPGFDSFAIRGSKVVAFHSTFEPLPTAIWNDPANRGWIIGRAR